MTKIQVNGALLAYDEAGTGSPVVLLHAGIADRRMWRDQIAPLATRHRVITVDLRGYGESELPPSAFAHHDDVVGLLDALGLASAALVGCSFGGAVAIDTALAHPHRVSALALLGTAVSGHEWSEQTNELWENLVGDVDPEDFAATAAGEVRFWVVVRTANPLTSTRSWSPSPPRWTNGRSPPSWHSAPWTWPNSTRRPSGDWPS